MRTPLAETTGHRVARPPLLVPVLRAGLGMAEAAIRLLPQAEMSFIGLTRDEETFAPDPYMAKVPDELHGRRVLVLDPMLATGGSLAYACQMVHDRGAGRITVVCILAAPEGLAHLEARASTSTWCAPRSTSASTTRPTSSPAWATPATASTACPEGPPEDTCFPHLLRPAPTDGARRSSYRRTATAQTARTASDPSHAATSARSAAIRASAAARSRPTTSRYTLALGSVPLGRAITRRAVVEVDDDHVGGGSASARSSTDVTGNPAS